MVYVDEAEDGSLDYADLEAKLHFYSSKRYRSKVKIGVFQAASNITGTLLDTDRVTIILHKYGAMAFWDYATLAPHYKIGEILILNLSISHEDTRDYYQEHKITASSCRHESVYG